MLKILNSLGEEVTLNAREQRVARVNQALCNALGYEVPITTLTTVVKRITEQKFFEISPADMVPIRIGNGAWSTNLETFRSFAIGDDFSTGVINTGANNSRLASGDVGVDAVNVKIKNWAKTIGYTLFDLEHAAKSGNWDLVTAKERARKKNWDLGIQKVAFLGLPGDSTCLGLYNQPGTLVDSTTLTQSMSSLASSSPAGFSTFVQAILNAYRANCNRTAWPTHFVIPESDYLGLAAPSSPTFPLKSILQVFEETMQTMTKNKEFKVIPCAYGDKAYNPYGKQVYLLYNYDEESLRMDIPVDYTATLANSIDNFAFQNVALGQFTGVVAYRPREVYSFMF
jgi:hypothetical protein